MEHSNIRLSRQKRKKTITSEFLLSYILPLFAFDFTVWYEVVLFLIFFTVFAFLCIRHNHFSVNVMLELMGCRFYSCVMKIDGVQINKIIISKATLATKINDEINICPVNNEYAVHVDAKPEAAPKIKSEN